MNTPPTLEQLWEELVEEAGEEEIAAADAMSTTEVEAYLAASGFDVEAERAKAAAFLDDLAGRTKAKDATAPQAKDSIAAKATGDTPARDASTPAKPASAKARSGGRRVSPAVLLTAAAVAAAGGAAMYAAIHEKGGGHDQAVPEPSSPVPAVRERDLVAARDLRAKAQAAMGEGQPDVCVKLLDQAKAKDPAGDQAPDVVTLRQRADDAMVEPPLPRQGPK
ncbi:MAG TPA: hypothetical protein VGG39_34070 [Polyangiaceae bacterium]